jgi:hypothetical protein
MPISAPAARPLVAGLRFHFEASYYHGRSFIFVLSGAEKSIEPLLQLGGEFAGAFEQRQLQLKKLDGNVVEPQRRLKEART